MLAMAVFRTKTLSCARLGCMENRLHLSFRYPDDQSKLPFISSNIFRQGKDASEIVAVVTLKGSGCGTVSAMRLERHGGYYRLASGSLGRMSLSSAWRTSWQTYLPILSIHRSWEKYLEFELPCPYPFSPFLTKEFRSLESLNDVACCEQA